VVVTAVRGEHGVRDPQVAAAADGDGLLPDGQVQRAGDEPLLALGLHRLLEAPAEAHRAVATLAGGEVELRIHGRG